MKKWSIWYFKRAPYMIIYWNFDFYKIQSTMFFKPWLYYMLHVLNCIVLPFAINTCFYIWILKGTVLHFHPWTGLVEEFCKNQHHSSAEERQQKIVRISELESQSRSCMHNIACQVFATIWTEKRPKQILAIFRPFKVQKN